MKVVITDDPKRQQLRLEYEYGNKGDKGYSHRVRFMTIRPKQSQVELKWQHEEPTEFTATQLDNFLSKGFGSFGLQTSSVEDGKNTIYRGMFDLEANRLTYLWESSAKGTIFNRRGYYDLTREAKPVDVTP